MNDAERSGSAGLQACRGAQAVLRAALPERHVVLTKRQIESPGEMQLRRRGTRNDPRHAVIAKTRWTAEDERVARLERDRVDWVLALQSTEQKPRAVAD